MTDLIAIGNPWRGDDGVGPYILAGLAGNTLPEHRHCISGDVSELLALLPQRDEVLLLDALDGRRAGLEPGTVLRMDPEDERLALCNSSTSTHNLGLMEALALARSLALLPRQLEILAVAGVNFDHGRGLSPGVQDAAERLIAELGAAAGAVGHALDPHQGTPQCPHLE